MSEQICDLSPVQAAEGTPGREGWTTRQARRAVLERLGGLSRGRLTLVEGGRRWRFGPGGAGEPAATVTVLHADFWAALLTGGSLGAGEAYMDGYWMADDPAEVVRLMILNQAALASLEHGWGRALAPLRRAGAWLFHALRRNTRAGSRRNIAAHYDLGNDLFALFLDETMTYSSAIWTRPELTLAEAQAAKYERICRKLALRPDDHVLEIGSGWGGFALHAAGRYGCRVTTTTISPSQYRLASERIAESGLVDRITLLQADYRDLRGQFDKIVSIEMIEAVGRRYLPGYFLACSELLRPEGMMLLQAITTDDRRYETERNKVDFIQRHVFPGSAIPSLAAISGAMASGGDLSLIHMEDFAADYARTLRLWRERFMARLAEVRALGYDERFIRMWEYYLALCEGSFAERWIGVAHLLLAKPLCRRPPIRGAIA